MNEVVVDETESFFPWKGPAINNLKITFDASWSSANLDSGFGLIIRNSTGESKGAKSGVFKASYPEKSEALAWLQGVKWARDLKL